MFSFSVVLSLRDVVTSKNILSKPKWGTQAVVGGGGHRLPAPCNNGIGNSIDFLIITVFCVQSFFIASPSVEKLAHYYCELS